MMKDTDKSGGTSCHEAELLFEKKIFDNALSENEQTIFSAHLEQCERCRNAHRLTSSLPLLAIVTTEGEVDTKVASLAKGLFHQRHLEKKRKVRGVVFAVAAAFAAVLLYGVWTVAVKDESPSVALTLFACESPVSVALVTGVLMTYCEGQEPGTIIKNGAAQVSLKQGSVALFVDPQRVVKKVVSVKTPSGEVTVKGTVFAVHVNNKEERVEVFRGIVEVVPGRKEVASFHVAANYGARLTTSEVYPLLEPIGEGLLSALYNYVSENNKKQSVSTDPLADSAAGVHRNDEVDNAASVDGAADDVNGETKLERNVSSLRRKSTNSIEELIQGARTCLLAQDWACAASRYQKVLREYPRHPASNAVLISLAKIELRNLNLPQKALAHYNAYLKKSPMGPLSEEALFGSAKSLRRLGRYEAEKKALTRFVVNYPSSSLLAKVKSRLEEL